jgi:hypothetical protein
MKNKIKRFGIIVIVAVIGFSTMVCKTDGDGGPKTITYTGTANDVTYTLKITDKTMAPIKDSEGNLIASATEIVYELTDGSKISTGRVDGGVTSGTLRLRPSSGYGEFTAIVSGSIISSLSGTIIWDDYTENELPGEMNG